MPSKQVQLTFWLDMTRPIARSSSLLIARRLLAPCRVEGRTGVKRSGGVGETLRVHQMHVAPGDGSESHASTPNPRLQQTDRPLNARSVV
jgi:hypothetical protein